ncbi:MAG: hypothetical protein WCA01_05895 [Burkholderiales bacterium]|jgi:hypothetical protein
MVQLLAVAFLVFMLSVILHKGLADVSLIAELHSGREFWLALARHFIGTLSGG